MLIFFQNYKTEIYWKLKHNAINRQNWLFIFNEKFIFLIKTYVHLFFVKKNIKKI